MSTASEYARAFKDMKDGVLLIIVASVVGVVVAVALLLAFFATLFSVAVAPAPPPVGQADILFVLGSALIMVVAGALACVVVALVAIYAKFLPGVSRLARLDPDYSTPSTLMKIGYYVGLPLDLVGLLVIVATLVSAKEATHPGQLFAGLVAGGIAVIVGVILLIIASIGLIILCFKLGDKERISEYKTAGVLLIVGFVLGFIPYVGVVGGILDLIALVLLYMSLSKSLRKYTGTAEQPALPPPT